ncbi:MAG: hypothetical protein SNJ57_09270 [Cyanobacteriota bacterium]
MTIEDLILSLADGTKSVSRIAKEAERLSGQPVLFQHVAALLNARQIATPNRVQPLFEPRFRQRPYSVWVTRHRAGSAPYGGPHSFQIDTVVAATAVEALQKWAIATHQQDPADPNLLILPPYISVPGTNKRARNVRDRIDALPATGVTIENIQSGGIMTDTSETPVLEGWDRVLPDGTRVPVTEDERAIALSEWVVPNIDSVVQSQATWWRQVRRIWGDAIAANLHAWLQAHDSEREWQWFDFQQERLTNLSYERRFFIPKIPVYWQPQPKPETPEARGLMLRFTWQQLRQACLDGYARELHRNPEPQQGKSDPLPIPNNTLTMQITEQEFIERSRQQWERLQRRLDESRLSFLRSRLAPSIAISPASVSSAKNPFLAIALQDFWEGHIPEDIYQFALHDWQKARDLTLWSFLWEESHELDCGD